MNKIIDRIVTTMIHELVDEFFRAYVKNYPVWVRSFHFISYSLGEMCLSETHAPINNQGVERIRTRFFSNCFSCTARNTIAITFNKRIKKIYRIQLGIDLHFFQSRYYKRILDGIVYDEGEIHFVIRI